MGASGGLLYGFFEQIRIHKMRAGTGGEETAVFDKPHAPQVDLPVASDCVFHRTAGFGESGRVQDDHIVGFSLLFQLRQQFKYVCALERDPVFHAVKSGIFLCLQAACPGGVDAQDAFGACDGCIQGERSCMGKAVQYFFVSAESLYGEAVVFLI